MATCQKCQRRAPMLTRKKVDGVDFYLCPPCFNNPWNKPSGIGKAHLLVALLIMAGLVLATCGGSK